MASSPAKVRAKAKPRSAQTQHTSHASWKASAIAWLAAQPASAAAPKSHVIPAAISPAARPSVSPISAIDATLREAAIYQRERRAEQAPAARSNRVILRRADLRQKVRVRKTRNAVCFVVDASWSMAAEERMRATKSAVLSLLRDAYQRRDQVGLVSFQRDYATLLLPLTNSIELAQKYLQTMPTGGKTPLSRGLMLGYEVLERARKRDPEVIPLMVLLTDGQANVAMGDLPPQAESYALADFVATQSILISGDRYRASNLRARPGPAACAASERALSPAGRSARGRIGRAGSLRIRKLGIMSWK